GNFSASTVTMTENGSPIAATLETYETITPADNTLVWRPKNVSDSYVWPNPGADDVYTVAISNVVIFTLESGYTTQNFFYTVIVFDPAVSGATVPGTPTSVRASDGTYTNTVRVEWAASEDADYYQIWRNLSDSLTGATCVKERHNSTLYWDNPPLPLTVFWYFVRAGNSEGFSSYSASDYGWAGMETPDAPQDVRASDGVHTDAVRVTWTKVDGATLYRLYRSRSNHQASAATLINRGADFDSYRDETVVPGTTYWYWVRAENAAGWGAYSGSDSGFATTNPPVPEPPEKVYASDGRFNSAIFVQWDVSDLAHGYEVWRNTVDSTASATKIHDATSAASVMDYAVLPGRFYWYWVRATNDVGVSDWSIHDVGFANVAGPSAPLVWASQGAALDRIRVIWLPTARTRGYEVWRNDSDTLIGATQLTNLPASRIFHDDWNVLPGQTNYYFVRATNLLAKGDFSDGAEGYTYWAPLAPTNVVATDGDYADRVVISWNAAPGAYSVWRSSNDNMSAATRIYYDSVSGCPDVTVTPGRYYYYQVSVASGGITSGLSAVDSGYAENSQPPPAPVPIASQGEYSAVFITWPHLPEVDPVESYDICRSEYDTMAGAVTLAVRFAQNNHFDWTTASDRGYYYSVRARDADGTGPWSAGAYGYVAGMVDAKPDIMGMAWNDSLGLMGLDLTNLIAGATNYVETSPQLGAGAVWTTYSRIMASQTGLRWYDLGDLSSRTGLFYRIRIEPKQ
ncbi:MAG: fibronectin type III domain-containing protein, partial [Verrucomicrobia bacterium]|nr:fibronectin type III domain-containing protein [Verrucomicrobiota bacterium]